MITNIIQLLLMPDVILAMMVGVVGGIIVGALPGLSAAMAVALLIPVTFKMSPIAGLVMLTSVYTSAIYGGSITACLLHTPGTPASAATAMDGYALTKQGKGLKAIGISTIASMFGGTLSAIALLLLAPMLGQISLKFGSLEYFFLALFGLTIIGSLAGDSMVKGIMSGVFGLLIGVIGIDMMMGVPRFTLGFLELESGISLVPAMIGLFSIAQVLGTSEDIFKGKTTILNEDIKELQGEMLPNRHEFKRIFPIMVKSSIIGILVGILPGAGADIGSWVSYNEAKKASKNPEDFGKGSIEGIAASESANNAVTGGALIPLLTLGIPGSSVAAILLGGLMIQGLVPGHELFTKYGEITYSVIIGFLIANILMGIVGLLIAKTVVKISTVSLALLSPIIIGLSTVGAYAIRNSLFDVYVMMIFGLIGYLMKKNGFAAAPVVLGMILGPMLESNFRQALIFSRGHFLSYFISRPISVVIAAMVVLALLSPILMKKVNKKAKAIVEEAESCVN